MGFNGIFHQPFNGVSNHLGNVVMVVVALKAGWWFGIHNFSYFSRRLMGFKSSQVTKSYFSGVAKNHQPVFCGGNCQRVCVW